uniref:hypothetical protein n=1 Tax=Streptomyces chartreusis TaxID=1969 RepID=UPI003F49375D
MGGLVDHRTTLRPSSTGRIEERVIAAVEEALCRQRVRSKGTVKGPVRRPVRPHR